MILSTTEALEAVAKYGGTPELNLSVAQLCHLVEWLGGKSQGFQTQGKPLVRLTTSECGYAILERSG